MIKIEAIVRPERVNLVLIALEEAGCTGYHLFNIVVHLLNTLLIYDLLRRTMLTRVVREKLGIGQAAAAMLGFDHGNPMWLLRAFGHSEGTVNLPAVQDAHLDSLIEAAEAATTEEGQMKAHREFEMALMKQHNQIWGPLQPRFQVSQPWVEGFNGEYAMGNFQYMAILARLWIDSELKKAMGH